MIKYSILVEGQKINVVNYTDNMFVLVNPLFLVVKGSTPIEIDGEDSFNIRWAANLFREMSKQTLNSFNMLREDITADDFPEPNMS